MYKMKCEICGHEFQTSDKMAECPACGDYETYEIATGESVAAYIEHENKVEF